MLPYFKQSERWFNAKNPQQHGLNGSMYVNSPSSENRTYPLDAQVVQSWEALGVVALPDLDLNAGDNIGLGEMNENRNDGRRQIANVVYPLDGVTVLTDTMVQSVLVVKSLNGTTRATGIQLVNGTQHFVGKEVIVSAGAYRTPQVYSLSPFFDLRMHKTPRLILQPSGPHALRYWSHRCPFGLQHCTESRCS